MMASCGGATSAGPAGSASSPTGSGAPDPASFALQVATTDLYSGTPQRVQLGVFSSTAAGGILLLTSGTVEVAM